MGEWIRWGLSFFMALLSFSWGLYVYSNKSKDYSAQVAIKNINPIYNTLIITPPFIDQNESNNDKIK